MLLITTIGGLKNTQAFNYAFFMFLSNNMGVGAEINNSN